MADLFGFIGGGGSGGGGGTLSSVGLSMPSAFSVTNSPLTSNGVLNVIGAGSSSQYIDGTGALQTFPTNVGGGSAVIYYLNGSVNQGVIGGNTYYEMDKTAVFVPNADFSISADGYVAQFITDPNDPQLPFIPGGAWQFQLYFNASSSGGNPRFYIELYKYDGVSLSLISSNSAVPESITGGTTIDLYTTLIATPQTPLALTDRIAVRVYVIHSGRTITLHTQGVHICKVTTTFTYGIVSLNGLTDSVQYLSVGTSGTDFNINQTGGDTNVFNLPVASALNTGKLSNTDWSTFNNKQNALSFGNLTESTSSVLTLTGNLGAVIGGGTTIQVKQSSALQSGYLSSTDWNTFNSKFNLPSLTSGSVLFSNGTTIAEDNTNLFWDNSTKRLGIGTNTPSAILSVSYNGLFTIPKNLLKITQNFSNYEVIKILDTGSSGGSQVDSVYASWGFGIIADAVNSTRVRIKGISGTSGTASIKVQDGNSNEIFLLRDDSFALFGNLSLNSYLWSYGLGGQFGFTNESGFPGLYLNSSYLNKFYFTNGGSGNNAFAQINTNNGNWLIGNPSTNVYSEVLSNTKLLIQGVDATTSNFGLKIQDSASANLLVVRNDGNVGIGTATLTEKLVVNGNIKTTGGLLVQGSFASTPVGAGFELEYALGTAYVTSYNRTSSSWLPMQIRASNIDLNSAATTIMSIGSSGLTIFDVNIILGSTTGTQIGTATSQKLSFYGSTPITQPLAVTTPQGIADALRDLGLLASSTINSITLTTTGTTGTATYTQATNTLNIPNYSGAGYISSVWNVTTQTGASYSASNNDYVIINATSFQLTLPAISTAGVRVGVKMVNVPASSTAIQVLATTATATIDGQVSNVAGASTNLYIYNQWDAYTLISYDDGGVFKWAIES